MKKFLVVTVTGLVVWAGTAGAQDETAELAQMLERMRRDVIDLQAYVYNAGELPENLVGTAGIQRQQASCGHSADPGNAARTRRTN